MNSMNRIYIAEGKELKGEAAYPKVWAAAIDYIDYFGLSIDLDDPDIFVIERKDEKPFFENLPIEFSLSHSDGMWICVMSDSPCGIDIQVEKNTDVLKIAERFYKPDEVEYVRHFGKRGFFQMWTRREAYGKMIGTGFWGEIPKLVNEDLELIEKFNDYYISEIEIGDGITCAVCMKDLMPQSIVLL